MEPFIQTNENSEQLEPAMAAQQQIEEPQIAEPVQTTKSLKHRTMNDVDAELEELLSKQRATIKVVGAGGGGNNTITRMTEVGIIGAETIAINTDAQDLLYATAGKKILIGRDVTRGLGAGSDPRMGEEAARENEKEIKQALDGCDMVFITCGLVDINVSFGKFSGIPCPADVNASKYDAAAVEGSL